MGWKGDFKCKFDFHFSLKATKIQTYSTLKNYLCERIERNWAEWDWAHKTTGQNPGNNHPVLAARMPGFQSNCGTCQEWDPLRPLAVSHTAQLKNIHKIQDRKFQKKITWKRFGQNDVPPDQVKNPIETVVAPQRIHNVDGREQQENQRSHQALFLRPQQSHRRGLN